MNGAMNSEVHSRYGGSERLLSGFDQIAKCPEFRYMGSKHRLLPWIQDVFSDLDFESAWDPFSGGGSVSYLMKTMGKRVVASDFLNFPTVIATAIVENSGKRLEGDALRQLLEKNHGGADFIEKTFSGVFFTPTDLRFLDLVAGNIPTLQDPHLRALAMGALLRSCLKRQPRGVFTITGDLSRYDDGRRDLRLSLAEHFFEQLDVLHKAVFSNGQANRVLQGSVFDLDVQDVDLVYLDPPYVPRSDDNCYIKRYHFLEGLSCYWKGVEIDYGTKTKKIVKRHTPFSYRSEAIPAFAGLFRKFQSKKIVLSYSSNGFPDLEVLVDLMKQSKSSVRVYSKAHKYHFGTHDNVERSRTTEYLIVGE